MFDRLIDRLFSLFKGKKRDAAPPRSDFLSPKDEPVKKPTVLLAERKAPLPVLEAPAILLPAASKPVEEFKPVVQLPPDIDPNEVIVVRHDLKKADGERFRYTDKPLKPLGADGRKPELIKYDDKAGDVIKYEAVQHSTAATRKTEAEIKKGEVFKYTPARIVIKN